VKFLRAGEDTSGYRVACTAVYIKDDELKGSSTFEVNTECTPHRKLYASYAYVYS